MGHAALKFARAAPIGVVVGKQQMFIKDHASLWACLQRMCLDTDSVLKFDNEDSTIRFEVHACTSSEADNDKLAAYADVYAFAPWLSDSQGFDRTIEHILEQEFGRDYDEDVNGFLIDSASAMDPEDVGDLVATLNRLNQWSLCPCGQRLIMDKAPMCLLCQAMGTHDSEKVLDDACIICLAECRAMHLSRTTCCGKVVHRLCAKRHAQNDSRCPACRKRHRSGASSVASSSSSSSLSP
jgi:hypothetical protein